MTELKTLKDLQHYNFEGIPMNNGVAIDERNLKAEVVKWVNRYNKQNFKDNEPKVSADTLRWIKHFFNLTEEDIK